MQEMTENETFKTNHARMSIHKTNTQPQQILDPFILHPLIIC